MSRADKAALAKGTEAIRKAEAEAKAVKLDGTLDGVKKAIEKLYGEITRARDELLTAAVRTSLPKAIKIGELLHRVRASRKGKWLLWLKDNAPFDQKTAWNYMRCYDNRAKLGNVPNLTAAYALLSL